MRVFRTYYRDKNGKRRQAKKWYIDFVDHRGIRRCWPALESKEQSRELGRQIKRLIRFTTAGDIPDLQLQQWIENLPKHFLKLLVSIGLLEPHKATAGKPLCEHLKDFHKSLVAKGDTAKQAKQVTTRVKRIIEGCRFRNWSDISASRIEHYLAELRNEGLGISAQTSNFYLKSIKQFCKWMVADRRALDSPIEHLRGQNVNTDRRHDRRALEPNELRRLLEATLAGPKRFGMTGHERALLYRFTAETGLRRNEIKSLKISSFNFENLTVTVKAAYSKHRREDVLPLREDTAAELQEFFKGKLPTVKAFGGSYKELTAKTSNMIKADLTAAGIPYLDDAGRYADFHCLRHTTGSLLASSGTHPKVAQSIMRHSTIDLTMSRYTHIFRGQESEAIKKLPDLSQPSSQAQANKKTGTDDADVAEDKNFAIYLAKQGHIPDYNSKQQVTVKPVFENKTGLSTTPGGIRTPNLRFRRPTLYPIELQAQKFLGFDSIISCQ
jgi:integrase